MDTPTPEQGAQDVAALRASLQSVYADLLTYEQACEALGISRWTLSRLVRDGKLSAVQVRGRRFIPRAALASHIDEVHAAVRSEVERYGPQRQPRAARRPATESA